MTGQPLARMEAWFAANREKALALLAPHVPDGEEVVAFAAGWQYPLDVLTWLPFVGNLIEMRKKRYLLAVTRTRLIILRVRLFRFEALASDIIPLSEVESSSVRAFPLFCNLRLTFAGGSSRVFKEMSYEAAAGLKDAIDQGLGRPAEVK